MKSMTGFGRAEIDKKKYRLRVEMASVNGRFLEIVFRMPRSLAGVEARIKEVVGHMFSRGKITITVNLEETPAAMAEAIINPETARIYYAHLVKLKKELKLSGEVELGHLVANPQLLANTEANIDETLIWSDLEKLVKRASTDLKKMRAAEGRNLKKDMQGRIKHISQLVAKIEKQSPRNVSAYKKRLEKRLKELDSGVELDSKRLAEEITVYAERSDVTEECIRLKSHNDMFLKTLNGNGDAGKRLNFILQEMGREANTIGSKSLSSDISVPAIEMKEEVEKLREQVQNIE